MLVLYVIIVMYVFSLYQNLEQRKSYPCPDLFSGEPQRVSDLYWVSTHVFAVVYTPRSPTDNTPSLIFIFTSVSSLSDRHYM